MTINNFFRKIDKGKKDRRDFNSTLLKLFASGLFASWPLSKLITVSVADESEGDKEKPKVTTDIKTPTPAPAATPIPIHPLAKPYIGQKLKYEITFLGILKAAEGKYTFKQGPGATYIGVMEAKAAGIIGKITKHRTLTLESNMSVKKINGVERFIANIFKQTSKRTDKTYKSTYIMNYAKKRYLYKKEKNGNIIKKRNRRIKGDLPYDDFVVAGFNFRSQVYGKVDFGKTFTVTTIPYKGVTSFKFHIATKQEMEKKIKWISKYKDTKYMAVIKIDKKIFGMKSGIAYMLGTEKLLPLAAAIEDVSGFGRVNADIVR